MHSKLFHSLRRRIQTVAAISYTLTIPVHAGFVEDLVARFPAAIDAKVAVAWPGLHSVVRGQEVVFVKDDLSILINGDVIDLNASLSLTKQLREASKQPIDVTHLNTSDAIVFGAGPAKLYVFSDPDCPYCEQLEHELQGLTNTQVFLFPFPLTSLHPQAAIVSESIWCAEDRASTWRDYVLRGVMPKTATCSNPIARNLALGEQLQIQGTPAIIFEDGTLVPGAIPLARLEDQLSISHSRNKSKAAP